MSFYSLILLSKSWKISSVEILIKMCFGSSDWRLIRGKYAWSLTHVYFSVIKCQSLEICVFSNISTEKLKTEKKIRFYEVGLKILAVFVPKNQLHIFFISMHPKGTLFQRSLISCEKSQLACPAPCGKVSKSTVGLSPMFGLTIF